MKNGKKMLAALFGILLGTSLLAGCASGKKSKTEEKELDYDKYVTLGDYKSISLESKNIDAQVKTQIDSLLESHATYDKVTKGKVKDGDTVNIHYVGKVDGKEFEGGALRKEDNPNGYDLTIGSKSFIDGFEEALIGKKIGGTYDINVTFPEVYERNADLAGKPAVFTVTVNSKRGEEHLPEFNDDFVANNVSGFDTAEAYQKNLRDTAVQEQAWSQVYQASEIKDYPKSKMDELKERMKNSTENYLKQQGMKMEDYLKAQNITQEQMDEQMDEAAKQTTGEWLVQSAIAEKEKIEVKEEDYQKAIDEVMTANNLKDEKAVDELFQSYYGASAKKVLADDLLGQNVREYLSNNVSEK